MKLSENCAIYQNALGNLWILFPAEQRLRYVPLPVTSPARPSLDLLRLISASIQYDVVPLGQRIWQSPGIDYRSSESSSGRGRGGLQIGRPGTLWTRLAYRGLVGWDFAGQLVLVVQLVVAAGEAHFVVVLLEHTLERWSKET